LAHGVNVLIFTYNIFAKKLRNFWQSKVEQFMLNKNLITLLFKKTAQNGQRYRKFVVIPGFDNKIFFISSEQLKLLTKNTVITAQKIIITWFLNANLIADD
jgi:hypothetical protein